MPTLFRDLPPAQLEEEVVEWSQLAIRQGQDQQNQSTRLKVVPRIIQYIEGQQWPSRTTAYGTSRPVSNRMFRQYWDLISLLTSGKPEPQIKVWGHSNDMGYSELQSLLQDIMKIWGSGQAYVDALQDIIGWGLLCHGIGKVQWNQRLNGGMGDSELRSVRPTDLMVLGGDGTFETGELFIEEQVVSMAALRRRYGRLAELIKPDTNLGPAAMEQVSKPSQLTSSEWSKISPQMRRLLGNKTSPTQDAELLFPSVRLYQFWMPGEPSTNATGRTQTIAAGKPWSYMVEPGALVYPRGRLWLMAGDRVMDDTCNPYFHAQAPYVRMAPLRACWNPEGMSVMGNLMGPQDILNRITAGLLETIKAGLIPTIITPRNSVSRGDLDNISSTISGGKLEYNQNAGSAPTFRPQPQVSQLAMPMMQMIKEEMGESTGAAAIDAAAQKDQIPSHDTMELIQNSRSTLVRVMGGAIEGFLNRGGSLIVANVLQFYSVGHRVALLGAKGISELDFKKPVYGSLSTGMAPESFIRRFQFRIKPGSALSFEDDNRLQNAGIVRRAGDLSQKGFWRIVNETSGENFDYDRNHEELLAEAIEKIKIAAVASQAAGPQKG